MNILIFLLSYCLGLASLFVNEKVMVFYVLGMGFYTVFWSVVRKFNFKRYIAEPMVISIFSSYFIELLEGHSIISHLFYLLLLPYLSFLIKGRKEQEEEKNDALILIEKVIMPIVMPITSAFLMLLSIKSGSMGAIMFLMLYFLGLHYTINQISSKGYGIVMLVIQNGILFSLFSHLIFLTNLDKWILLFAMNSLIILNLSRRRFSSYTHSKNLSNNDINTQKQSVGM